MPVPKILYRTDFGRRIWRLYSTFLLLLLVSPDVHAQTKQWYFFDRNVPKAEAKRILLEQQLEPVVWSQWFHAWSAEGEMRETIFNVDSIARVAPITILSSLEKPLLGFALEQIQGNAMIDAGLSGKGVKIGIIDGGFLKADKVDALQPLIDAGRLKLYRNYLENSANNPFSGSAAMDDGHGTEVWTLTGGNDKKKGLQFGLASEADYYLARTDHGAREERREEDFLIAALEWLDSLGVKLVNVSLGYNTGFDNPSENYTQEMMDGKTTLVSLACQKASDEKGMLIVVAAGNDGGNSWKIVNAPADPPGVLTVGATDLKYWKKMPFSSIGTDFTSHLKPDISCFSSSGTSFSAPVITGLAACIWQKKPALSNVEVKALIMQSGHLSGAPNNYIGHGVPDAGWIAEKLDMNAEGPFEMPSSITTLRKKVATVLLEGDQKKQVVLYHKKDRFQVIKEDFFSQTESKLTVKHIDGAAFTTIVVDRKWVMEVEWR